MAKASVSNGELKNYFKKEKIYLKFLGLSFDDNESIAYRIYSVLVLFFANFMFPVLTLREVFLHEFEVVADMLIYLFASFVALMKTATVLRNRTRFKDVLRKLEKEPFAVNLKRGGQKEGSIIRLCIKITNIQTMVYWIAMFLSVLIMVIYTIVKRVRNTDYHDWELPYGPLTILDISRSPNFEITWCYQVWSAIWVVSHFATIDLLIAAVLAHISFQFKLVQNNLKLIMANSYKLLCEGQSDFFISRSTLSDSSLTNFEVSKIPWIYLQTSIKQFVDYHLAVVDLATDMEEVFSELLLLAYTGTLGTLCFLIHRATALENSVQTARCLGEIMLVAFQVAFVCFWGEQVGHQSQQVANAAYESNFVGADLRFQKSVVLIIRRSQNAVKLTAGKIADVGLSTFTWILRASYSAYMVLQSRN